MKPILALCFLLPPILRVFLESDGKTEARKSESHKRSSGSDTKDLACRHNSFMPLHLQLLLLHSGDGVGYVYPREYASPAAAAYLVHHRCRPNRCRWRFRPALPHSVSDKIILARGFGIILLPFLIHFVRVPFLTQEE